MWGMPITNWENWGKLVMAWAKDETTRPKDVAALNQQMDDNHVGGQFSTERFSDVAFAQAPNPVTVQIFLPTAAAIERAIQRMQEPGFQWTLPDFYSLDAFDRQPVDVKEADNMKFLAERIGDYAIGQCG